MSEKIEHGLNTTWCRNVRFSKET